MGCSFVCKLWVCLFCCTHSSNYGKEILFLWQFCKIINFTRILDRSTGSVGEGLLSTSISLCFSLFNWSHSLDFNNVYNGPQNFVFGSWKYSRIHVWEMKFSLLWLLSYFLPLFFDKMKTPKTVSKNHFRKPLSKRSLFIMSCPVLTWDKKENCQKTSKFRLSFSQ